MNYINQGPIKAAISAVGAFVPEDKLTNADLEMMVDKNYEWILARTGIKERRILKDPTNEEIQNSRLAQVIGSFSMMR